jgi:hypothetical protein
MKNIPARRLFQVIILFLAVLAVSPIHSQESVPYLVNTDQKLELVGFPVHQPALDTGVVQSVTGNVISWTPTFTERSFGSALPARQESYAEVVGPAGHIWLGHRMELDEVATRARTDHMLVITPSPHNTRGLPNTTLVGACLEVRNHLTVNEIWGQSLKNRLEYAKEPSSSFLFWLPALPLYRELNAFIDKGALTWHLANRPTSLFTDPLIIPPGNAVGVDFGEIRGSSLAITASSRNWRTAAPLRAGVNLLAYPYSQDLRLGVDWGRSEDGFVGLTRPNGNQDRIELVNGSSRIIYTPESQIAGGIRWRQMQSGSARIWSLPAKYLDIIPVGQGFVLWKTKPQPNHFFNPPKI